MHLCYLQLSCIVCVAVAAASRTLLRLAFNALPSLIGAQWVEPARHQEVHRCSLQAARGYDRAAQQSFRATRSCFVIGPTVVHHMTPLHVIWTPLCSYLDAHMLSAAYARISCTRPSSRALILDRVPTGWEKTLSVQLKRLADSKKLVKVRAMAVVLGCMTHARLARSRRRTSSARTSRPLRPRRRLPPRRSSSLPTVRRRLSRSLPSRRQPSPRRQASPRPPPRCSVCSVLQHFACTTCNTGQGSCQAQGGQEACCQEARGGQEGVFGIWHCDVVQSKRPTLHSMQATPAKPKGVKKPAAKKV